jgi:hypothetical protein
MSMSELLDSKLTWMHIVNEQKKSETKERCALQFYLHELRNSQVMQYC